MKSNKLNFRHHLARASGFLLTYNGHVYELILKEVFSFKKFSNTKIVAYCS